MAEESGRIQKHRRGGTNTYGASPGGRLWQYPQHRTDQYGDRNDRRVLFEDLPGEGPGEDGNRTHPSELASSRFAPRPHTEFRQNSSRQFDRYRENVTIYRSTVATIGETKSREALIESGGTHNFFYSNSSFVEFEALENETVQAASSSTDLIRKGHVWVPLKGGIQIVACHAPRFNNNILAVSELSTHVDVLFSDVCRPFKRCFMFQPGSRTILFETTCSNGLYKMLLSNTGDSRSKLRESFSVAVAAGLPQHQDAKMWHDKTGHPSAGRYLQITKFVKNVSSFHQNDLQALECVPCIMAKAKQSSVPSVASKVDMLIEEINIDLSGPFIPTINGEK